MHDKSLRLPNIACHCVPLRDRSKSAIVYSLGCSTPKTSTSSSSMTPKTTLKLSINPLTATLSIRFVVALYSVLRIVSSEELTRLEPAESWEDAVEMVENDLRTRGDSSLSTRNACRAAEARRAVGRGRSMVLAFLVSIPEWEEGKLIRTVSRGTRDQFGRS
jgi:hypothetical protein